jgi:hypothetical protein
MPFINREYRRSGYALKGGCKALLIFSFSHGDEAGSGPAQ